MTRPVPKGRARSPCGDLRCPGGRRRTRRPHALEQIEALKPDLVTLDLEMPQLDGIGVLREIQQRALDVAAIMVSAFTTQGAKTTTEALSLGAFDFI